MKEAPPPFIDREAIFKKGREAISQKYTFTKPTFIKPDIIAVKKKITLPPIDINKIDNPSYISYYQMVREKIRTTHKLTEVRKMARKQPERFDWVEIRDDLMRKALDAKFSIPYIVASSLIHGKFGLAELEESALRDPVTLALADKVDYEADPASGFPKYYSGEVIVKLKDGRELAHREQVNRGAADRPISNDDIVAKFMDNAMQAVSRARAEELRDALLRMEDFERGSELATLLAGC